MVQVTFTFDVTLVVSPLDWEQVRAVTPKSNASPSAHADNSTCSEDGILLTLRTSEGPLGRRIVLMANIQSPCSIVGVHLHGCRAAISRPRTTLHSGVISFSAATH
jgi:hypothetical protein